MVQELPRHKLSINLSKTVLHYRPGGESESFDVTVINHSGEFTSFQLELVAAGTLSGASSHWYRLSPSVSYKIPPGDRTHFQVEIIDVPPIRGGFVNSITLGVRIDALELGLQERRDLRLMVEGSPVRPLQLLVSQAILEAHPGQPVEIVAEVVNPNLKPAEALLDLSGLDPMWLPEGSEQLLTVPPEGCRTVQWTLQVPEPLQARRGEHFVTLDGPRSPTPVAPTQVTLKVLPWGQVTVAHEPNIRQLPEQAGRWLNPTQATTDFRLTFENESNSPVVAHVSLDDPDQRPRRSRNSRWRWPWQKKVLASTTSKTSTTSTAAEHADESSTASAAALATSEASEGATEQPNARRRFQLDPHPLVLEPGVSDSITVEITQRLPWLGWKRVKQVRVAPSLDTAEIGLQPDADSNSPGQQRLELHILPIIPFWLQGAGLLLLALLAIAPLLFSPRGHTQPVNRVQIGGRADEVVSAADDGTIRRWRVRGNRLKAAGVLEEGDKAVRVVRYRPVQNNQIVAGFENGALLLHDFLSQHTEQVSYQADDRVFDLAFTRDSRRLFSAHGSGMVWEWQVNPLGISPEPIQGIEVDFAIQAVGLVGSNDNYLAIAGRYNQLTLLDRTTGLFYDPAYIYEGGQSAYITSIATAGDRPNRFATADNQGQIAVWDIDNCLTNLSQCEVTSTWLGHGGYGVNQVALSADGCYLASVGLDGEARVWSLATSGSQVPESQTLRQVKSPLNAIDIVQSGDRLLVVSGGDDTRVRLDPLRLRHSRSPSGQCEGL